MSSLDRWPQLTEDERWIAEHFEATFADPAVSSEDLRARAAELRDDAERAADLPAVRRASLQMAERYEEAAAARPAVR